MPWNTMLINSITSDLLPFTTTTAVRLSSQDSNTRSKASGVPLAANLAKSLCFRTRSKAAVTSDMYRAI